MLRWRLGLAMGVILVSGGCSVERVAAQTASSGRSAPPTLISELVSAVDSTAGARHPRHSCSLTLIGKARPRVRAGGAEAGSPGARKMELVRVKSVEVLEGIAGVRRQGKHGRDGAIVVNTLRPREKSR